MPRFFVLLALTIATLVSINPAIASDNAIASHQENTTFLKPYRAVYEANYDFFLPLRGTAVRELRQQENGDWLLSHTIDSSLISLKETSLFSLHNNQIRTQVYQFQQKSIGKSRDDLLEFDWQQLLVRHRTNEPAGQYPMPENTLDKLNYQLKMRQDLAANITPLKYLIADRHNMKEYDFELIGKVVLDTPMGKLNTLELKRVRDADANRQTTIWLATDWDYLLVKIHQDERNKSFDILMSEGVLDGKAITGL